MRDIYRIFWKELVQVFRDRKLVFSTLILPVLLMPIFMFGPSLVLQRLLQGAQERKQEVAVLNLPEEALRALEQAGLSPKAHPDPEGAVREGKYPVGVRYEQGVYRVYGRLASGLTESQVAVEKVKGALQALKEARVAEALKRAGFSPEILSPFTLEVVDASPEGEKRTGLLGFLLPFFLVVFVLTGGQVVAVDATEGEKEKGTLEALLAAPVPLLQIALGKTLATVAMALLSGAAGLLGLALGGALTARFGGLLSGGEGQTLALGGQVSLDWGSFLALFLTALLLAFFMGAVMVSLGLFARSFKEAQSYVVPLQLLALLPLLFLQFRGFLELQTWHYLLPLFNVALLMDALLKGSATPLQAGLTWLSTLVYGGIALRLAVLAFAREDVVYRN
ncbi:ABC transporter permease [Thermus scotoductus]|uniref:Sodium ABC transporter permease n=1 Tax=Thermus scotoductus TaxID=37636 RepID=A0A430S1U5_THESC|nr:ABC transporter permease [Thermus scotoductus]RTH27572.1 sodium ABC transporter permease [Thermus scotoductus]RTI42124.1 sodium ABC transporter permease [Thermus scotoductus]